MGLAIEIKLHIMQIDQYEQIKLSSSLKKPFNNQIQKTPKNKKNNKIQRKHNK